MMSYRFILDLALILLTTKVFGLVTRRFNLPQVVGALIAGLVFGPAVLGVLHETDFLQQLSELGVIVIMFCAGLGTDLKELRQTGKAGFLVALLGVLLPLAGGFGFGLLFNRGDLAAPGSLFLQNIFIGTVLTATSVSITVETLREMGRLSTRVGNTILAAALIDDVLGLVCLTLVTSMAGDDAASLGPVLLKIALFFVFAIVVGILAHKLLTWYIAHKHNRSLQRYPVLAFVFCLVLAFLAEELFGVSDIIGAFIAGIVIGGTRQATYIESCFQPVSYMLFTPIFFAGIGINIEPRGMTSALVWATVALIAVAVLTKVAGCGLGARLCGMTGREALQVGVGMVCRGEVALIVANKGRALNILSPEFMEPIVIAVVVTTVITPVLLKLAFRSEAPYSGLQASALAERREALDQLQAVNHRLLDRDTALRRGGEDTGAR